jgi:acyl-coenzyme A thioesterase PaaI-like protein
MSFNGELGFISRDDGSLYLEPGPRHLVGPGTIHFGVLATLGEVAAAGSVEAPVVPTHLSLQLMRRASDRAPLLAIGRLLKSGRTLIFAEGEVRQEERLVAKVSVTFARVD